MKKVICLLLLACVLLSFAACTDGKVGQDTTAVTTASNDTTPIGEKQPISTALTLGDADGVYGNLFGHGDMIEIAITADADSFASMVAGYTPETYVSADITVNGNEIKNVGIAPEDTETLPVMKELGSSRISFRVQADRYTEQTLNGLDELVLDNMYGDPSCMRAYYYGLALRELGGQSPFMTYAKVTLNGEYLGFYLCCEAVADSYAARVFGQGATVTAAPSEIPETLLRAMEAETVADIEKTVDTDSFLRSFAVDTVLGNLIGYFNITPSDYALIENNGKYGFAEYDNTLCMGAYHMDANLAIQDSPYEPAAFCEPEERPLISKLTESEDLYVKYLDYVKTAAEYMKNAEQTFASLEAVIAPALAEDTTAFYSAEQHQANLVFSGVHLEEQLGDPGNVLVAATEDDLKETSALKYVAPVAKYYENVKPIMDFVMQRLDGLAGILE